ncbi:MAG TPA: RagB/SusD family nutrient uptake outer membrane protein [Gemmatimonadaceae bacterium]|nr:RagB/SusD family nutrient uptake outer membrane protein [Gemmatimonadaceae bacterium]
MHGPRFTRLLPTMIVAGAVALAAGCNADLTVPDFNNPSLEELAGNPSPTTIAQAAQGMLVGARSYMAAQNGYVSLLGILGRESYNFDPADTRFITEMLVGPLDPGSPAFGANLFDLRYRNIRLGNTILAAIGPVVGLSPEQKEAVRGFVKTIQAHDLLMVINTRDVNGAPIDVDIAPTGAPAPIATKADVFARIVSLLNEAQTHLTAGGTAFPFSLGNGFAGFDTPADFLKVNRAIKARVDVYMGNFAAALTSLGGSFIDTTASLDLGVYHVHSTGSGDAENTLFDPTGRAILAHPSIVTDAKNKANGQPDNRLTRKVTTLGAPKTVQGVTTDVLFTIYGSPSASVPIIRNEELILLRAEANIGLNNFAAAQTDINTIRVKSGGLAPTTINAANALDELLYNKRYSLLFEGGHRWIDMRHYNRLAQLPLAVATHTRPSKFPFPESECLPRNPQPPGCTAAP